MGNVFAAGTVATFATDVPLCDLPGVNVVIDGMATIAGSSCWTLHVVRWIVGRPPICPRIRYVIGAPDLITDVPLCGKRVVIISHPGKVALLPLASVNE